MPETWEDRVTETLNYLNEKAKRTFRSSSEGQTIEGAGCRLSGRSSWWPDRDGAQTIPDRSPSFLDQKDSTPSEPPKSLEWDIDLNVPMYTRDHLALEREKLEQNPYLDTRNLI